MKSYRYISALLTCLICLACKVEFDINGLDGEPVIFADVMVTLPSFETEDGTVIDKGYATCWTYLYAIPPTAGSQEMIDDKRFDISMYHNGDNSFRYLDIRNNTYNSSSIADVAPGDEFKVMISAEGLSEVTATAVVPQDSPKMTVTHDRIDGSLIRLNITIQDDPDSEDHYAFAFHKIHSEDGMPAADDSGEVLEPAFGSNQESLTYDIGPFDIIWNYFGTLYGISDSGFNGQSKTFEINFDYPITDPGKDFYRVGIYRISHERYFYEISSWKKDNDMLGFMGLAPPTFAYTNVEGGTGCMSCANARYTAWTAVPALE